MKQSDRWTSTWNHPLNERLKKKKYEMIGELHSFKWSLFLIEISYVI